MLRLRPVSASEEQAINKLLQKDLSTLYADFGQHVGTLAPGKDPEYQAKKWIESRRQDIYDLVCIDGNYCAFIAQHENARTVEIVAVLADVLATAFGALPVNLLATLLVKSSLASFCKCD